MASLADVAQRAGVSVATVSMVLRGVKRFTPAIERRVMEVAVELDYRPNRHARALRTGESNTLGVLAPDIANPFFPGLMKALESKARGLGYAILLVDANDAVANEREALALLASYGVDGVIWIPVGDGSDVRPEVPVVVLDRVVDGFDSVQADHFEGGAMLARHALEMGHRRIGLIAGPRELSSAQQRREGMMSELAESVEVVWESEEPFGPVLSAATLARLDEGSVTIVMCSNDLQAIAATRALRDAGHSVPDDVSVTGFDDIFVATFLEPPLTTIRQPVADLASEALRMLRARISNPDAGCRTLRLSVDLQVRASVSRVTAPLAEAQR